MWGGLFHCISFPTAPDYDRSQWLSDKFKLGLDFPNVGVGAGLPWGRVDGVSLQLLCQLSGLRVWCLVLTVSAPGGLRRLSVMLWSQLLPSCFGR